MHNILKVTHVDRDIEMRWRHIIYHYDILCLSAFNHHKENDAEKCSLFISKSLRCSVTKVTHVDRVTAYRDGLAPVYPARYVCDPRTLSNIANG